MSWHPVITNKDIKSLFEHFSCWRKWKVISGKVRFLSKIASCCQEWKIRNREKIYAGWLVYCLQNCIILTDLCLSIASKQARIWTGAGWSGGLKPILALRAFFWTVASKQPGAGIFIFSTSGLSVTWSAHTCATFKLKKPKIVPYDETFEGSKFGEFYFTWPDFIFEQMFITLR